LARGLEVQPQIVEFTLYRASICGAVVDSPSRVTERAGSERRATERLLRHCALVGRIVGGERAPARLRLEAKIGAPLTRRLLTELCRNPPREWY
jgi:hypothetical protein